MQPPFSDADEPPVNAAATLHDRLWRLQQEFETEPDLRERNQILREMMELNAQLAALRPETQ